MNVEERMEAGFVTLEPEERLDRAARRMHEHGCGALAVVDEERRALALVTERDVCMAAWRANAPLSMVPVREAMHGPPVTCRIGDALADAERLMQVHQLRRLIVVDGEGRLAGVIALEDVRRPSEAPQPA